MTDVIVKCEKSIKAEVKEDMLVKYYEKEHLSTAEENKSSKTELFVFIFLSVPIL